MRYSYDILGRRITKTTQEETKKYTYAGQQAIQEDIYTNSGTTLVLKETRENIYSDKLDDILSSIITDYTKTTPETNQYYYEKNHLGSITRITDTAGLIIEQYEYDSFGVAYASINNVEAVTTAHGKKTLSIKKGNGSETVTDGNTDELTIDSIRYKRYNGKGKIGNTRLYTGREYDAELKLYYNRARYYSPDLGRFINRDPIDVNDDINLYAYVGNNGVMYTDLSGESKQFIAGFLYGDYNENGNGWSIAGQVVAGFVPYYGQAADVKDFSYQWNNGSKTDIAFALIAFVPLIGDGAKAISNSGIGSILIAKVGKSGIIQKLVAKGGKNSLLKKWFGQIHGNSLDSPKKTFLYELTDRKTGKHLKYGITSKDPYWKRYTQKFLSDKDINLISEGTRRDMHRLEYETIISNPRGPLQLNNH